MSPKTLSNQEHCCCPDLTGEETCPEPSCIRAGLCGSTQEMTVSFGTPLLPANTPQRCPQCPHRQGQELSAQHTLKVRSAPLPAMRSLGCSASRLLAWVGMEAAAAGAGAACARRGAICLAGPATPAGKETEAGQPPRLCGVPAGGTTAELGALLRLHKDTGDRGCFSPAAPPKAGQGWALI